jgi:D-methionine transport system substrate-binding protein
MLARIALAASLTLGLLAGAASAETIKVGVTPGPHAQILEKVKEIAARDGLDIEILEFSDYVVPNQALNDGELNANSFQHKPYLDNQIADRGFDLVDVAWTVNFPMGIYSNKYESFEALPDGATIAIPNDPTNGGRALLILADKGHIKLNEEKGLRVTVADITENPRNFNFIELDAAQLPRSLDDTDASAVNSNYAIEAGLNPAEDPILSEGEKAPYVNLIAVRSVDKDAAWVKPLVDAYHSDEVRQFALDTFKGAVDPAW